MAGKIIIIIGILNQWELIYSMFMLLQITYWELNIDHWVLDIGYWILKTRRLRTELPISRPYGTFCQLSFADCQLLQNSEFVNHHSTFILPTY